ncbi:MAG: hypothetical protein H7203_14265 [Rhizobacter sp.]|nr:hypothetical protein [Burkholderiales bacterium]
MPTITGVGAGGARCCGLNDKGQLGNGGNVNSPAAVGVTGLASGVAAITSGFAHACAVMTSGGAVKCWGRNQYGQLGGGTQSQRLSPVAVSSLTTSAAAVREGARARFIPAR